MSDDQPKRANQRAFVRPPAVRPFPMQPVTWPGKTASKAEKYPASARSQISEKPLPAAPSQPTKPLLPQLIASRGVTIALVKSQWHALTFACAVAAKASRAAAFPYEGYESPGGPVLIFSPESDETVQRLLSPAGADLGRAKIAPGAYDFLDPQLNIGIARSLVREYATSVLILHGSPSLKHGARLDFERTTGGVARLAAFAADQGLSIVHVITSASTNYASRRWLDLRDMAIESAANVVIDVVAPHGDEWGEVSAVKSGAGRPLGRCDFRLREEVTEQGPASVMTFAPHSGTPSRGRISTTPGKELAVDEAEMFLIALLAPGPCAVKDIKAESVSAGISWATIRRAQALLRIRPRREGGVAGTGFWTWALPDQKRSG